MKKTFLLISINFLALLSFAQDKSIFIPASDPHIQYLGRFDFSQKDKPVFMYSATSIKIAFTGTSVTALMEDEKMQNWFTVKLDDSVFIFKSDKKDGKYILAKNLPDTKHTLQIIRRTEWHGGITTFLGFNLDSDRKILFLKKQKRIMEFIGDSYTCGYGNEGKSREEHFKYETENSYGTYAAITARSCNAGCVTICRSGIGMYQSGGGDKSFAQPLLYDEVVLKSKSRWNYKKNKPQVVAIELGANDLTKDLDSNEYINTYIKFVGKLRHQYPKAKIICMAGPANPGDEWVKFQSYVSAVVDHFKDVDKRVYYFGFSPFTPNGSDWHPNMKEHEQMANELISFVKKITGW